MRTIAARRVQRKATELLVERLGDETVDAAEEAAQDD